MYKQAVITVAVGKLYYLELAKNLLRSFLLWNNNSSIQFIILTDDVSYFKDFSGIEKLSLIQLNIEESEKSFTSKFLIFDHIHAEENLFIDCDCLIYGPLEQVFEQFKHHDFSAIGTSISDGEFFCSVPQILKQFNLSSIPWFVGSVYFFRNTYVTEKIVTLAKDLKQQYDALGFKRLRNKENEEPLFSVAMAINQQKTIHDDGSIKADRMFFKNCISNIISGKTRLTGNFQPIHQKNTLTDAIPVIIHFNDSFSETYEYLAEAYRLKHTHFSKWLLETLIFFKFQLKFSLIKIVKNIFRPILHRIIGPMKVRKNKRVA